MNIGINLKMNNKYLGLENQELWIMINEFMKNQYWTRTNDEKLRETETAKKQSVTEVQLLSIHPRKPFVPFTPRLKGEERYWLGPSFLKHG